MAPDELARSLKIKTGTLRRLRKELKMYREDAIRESTKYEDLKSNGADPYDVKHAENLLSEAKTMVPDATSRFEAAIEDLASLLRRAESGEVPAEALEAAREELILAGEL